MSFLKRSLLAAPALRHSPRDHAAALARRKGSLHRRPLTKSVRGKSRATVRSRPAHTHAISRVPAENASGPGLIVELLSRREPRRRVRLPLAAMSEERGREELPPQQACDERSSDGPVGNLSGLAGACRRGRRPDARAAWTGTTC